MFNIQLWLIVGVLEWSHCRNIIVSRSLPTHTPPRHPVAPVHVTQQQLLPRSNARTTKQQVLLHVTQKALRQQDNVQVAPSVHKPKVVRHQNNMRILPQTFQQQNNVRIRPQALRQRSSQKVVTQKVVRQQDNARVTPKVVQQRRVTPQALRQQDTKRVTPKLFRPQNNMYVTSRVSRPRADIYVSSQGPQKQVNVFDVKRMLQQGDDEDDIGKMVQRQRPKTSEDFTKPPCGPVAFPDYSCEETTCVRITGKQNEDNGKHQYDTSCMPVKDTGYSKQEVKQQNKMTQRQMKQISHSPAPNIPDRRPKSQPPNSLRQNRQSTRSSDEFMEQMRMYMRHDTEPTQSTLAPGQEVTIYTSVATKEVCPSGAAKCNILTFSM